MAEITLTGISKQFGSTTALHDINLTIADQELMVFVGPSGCGKSTLLRLIAGLEQASRGTVIIDGEDVTQVPPAKRGLSMVFQTYALYPHMTVKENMAFGLKMAKQPAQEINKRVQAAADMLQLTEHLDKKPRQLSGGQRQRVAIGRAIVREPRGFLFDEPLSNLDAALRVQMRLEIVRLQRELATTTIYVTHDQVEAMTMATRIVVLNAGRIEQVGTPLEIYRAPVNTFVAGFIGSPKMNFIAGAAARQAHAATIGIRPEHLSLSLTDGKWIGEVEATEHLGADAFFHVQVADVGRLTVRGADAPDLPSHGATVYVTPDEKRLYRFDEQGMALAAEKP